ncbi:MAG: transporter substrate-binding domain-containing protein [Thiotrichaceae bacterium]|nr:transporter substrate-binding domain-containing protein [Thiotrichaceae bacterium]
MSSLKKIGLLLCTLGLLSACGDEPPPPKVVPKTVQAPPPPNVMETIKARGKLLVGVKRVQTMLNTLNARQEIVGLEADLAKLFTDSFLSNKNKVDLKLVLPQAMSNMLLGRTVDFLIASLTRQELDELKGMQVIPLPSNMREVSEESDAALNYVILVRPEDQALIEQLNKFVSRIRDSGEYAKLYDLWVIKPKAREAATISNERAEQPTTQEPVQEGVVLPRPERSNN